MLFISFVIIISQEVLFYTSQKKGPYGAIGIKNSWKYEKDLIIFNEKGNICAIRQ